MNTIEIPKPCHENWNEMTPTAQGAFCGSCQVNVIDFSDKSPSEVLNLLRENSGSHLCGRFSKNQLSHLNSSYTEWESQSTSVFYSKFIFACLLVFGMTLFTGCIEDEEEIYKVGMVEMEYDNEAEQLDSISKEEKDVYYESEMMLGQIAPIINDIPEEPERFMKGEIVWEPDNKDSALNHLPDNNMDHNMMVKGKVVYNDPIMIQQVDQEMIYDTIQKENIIQVELAELKKTILPREIHITAWPNPTTDVFKVSVLIPENELYNIVLQTINGKVINELIDRRYDAGRIEISFDLNG